MEDDRLLAYLPHDDGARCWVVIDNAHLGSAMLGLTHDLVDAFEGVQRESKSCHNLHARNETAFRCSLYGAFWLAFRCPCWRSRGSRRQGLLRRCGPNLEDAWSFRVAWLLHLG
jgi:hypothetical protein